MELLKEAGQLAADIGDNLVRMRAHEATCVNEDAVALSGDGQAVPITSLQRSSVVRIEQKVASCGATGQGPGLAGLDDAASGHAVVGSEKRACRSGPLFVWFTRNAAAPRWRSISGR